MAEDIENAIRHSAQTLALAEANGVKAAQHRLWAFTPPSLRPLPITRASGRILPSIKVRFARVAGTCRLVQPGFCDGQGSHYACESAA